MAGTDPRDERALLVVAQGQRSLLEAVRELFAEFGWVDVIEDRRQGRRCFRALIAGTPPPSRSPRRPRPPRRRGAIPGRGC